MVNLTRASEELFRRRPDERFASLDDLYRHCSESKQTSSDRWCLPGEIAVHPAQGGLQLSTMGERLGMNDWSFTQACTLAKVSKDTVNKLSPETAARVFAETWPGGTKPMQVYTEGQSVRSIHGASYTRLHNIELLSMVREFATDFGPAQQAMSLQGDEDNPPANGLYCGEQDMFCFLIDPTGWTEIDGEAFAPGFFLWNSEVGRRTVGIQTFWFQAVCQNHIVWDAVDVVEFSRKHTANVHEALAEVRQLIERLVTKRDQRRDGFVQVIHNAMRTQFGEDADEAVKVLGRHGIPRNLATKALEQARRSGRLTIFSVVAALTEMVSRYENAGDRTTLDTKSSSLLSLAA
ncbi:MAG: DUF945 domain-containing protein [Phycisphaerae bacterium]|nr:DUF945 domain-containing protein [Phycisphaerae bacterium]